VDPIVNLSELATIRQAFMYMDVLPRHATFAAFNMAKCVHKHDIVTNKGKKTRTVYAPNRLLRYVQQQIKDVLLTQVPRDDCVHGFVSGRGCLSNATAHIGDLDLLINIDLKDFFPSISAKRVYGFWTRVFGFDTKVASVLTKVTTYDDHLAQGFLTSPDIANLCTWRLDQRLKGLAASAGMTYTRYADDLTFGATAWRGDAKRFVDLVRDIVAGEGLTVNEKKIAIMRRGRRQKVTGLVVSEHRVNVPRRLRRLLRTACHHWPQQTPDRRASIAGYLSWIQGVDPQFVTEMKEVISRVDKDVDNMAWAQDVHTRPFSEDIKSLAF
jgi:retron-type reverse transcriptase